MAALAADRNTPQKSTIREVSYKVKTGVTIFMGGGVCVDATGYAIPASDTTGLITVGVAQETVVGGAAASGTYSIAVHQCVAKFATALTITSVGVDVCWEDDQTVELAATATNDIVAGRVIGLDTDGAWIIVGGQN